MLGFWSPRYVTRRLAGLRAAGIPKPRALHRGELNCAEDELPALTQVVRLRRWVDAAVVPRATENG
jgi:predicted nuclease of restriction endonuclease-like RecB superfamily